MNSVHGILSRLARDTAGNVLAIAAAILVPMVAVVGGAVDMSRYHMATTRMQSACDSGALAARKVMGDNNFEESDRQHGLAFFDQNYPDGTFGLEDLTRDYESVDGIVTGTASGSLPMALMGMFGFDDFRVIVTCSAEINISNTDIMFVLDVTGSMNCPDDGAYCPSGNNNNTEHSYARIKGLRSAVMDFYDIVAGSTSSSAQVRIGIVPYSSGINVGHSIPGNLMASSAPYQTRVPQFESSGETELLSFTVNNVYNRGSNSYWYYWYNPSGHSGVRSQSQCNALAAASELGFADSYIEDSIQNGTLAIVSETTVGTIRTRIITARGSFSRGVPVAWYSRSYSPPCYVDVEYYRYYADFRATIVEDIAGAQEFDEWHYKQHSWDVSGMYADGAIVLPTGANGSNQRHTWDGCIEEAATTTDSNFDPLPSGAFDLNINLVPSTEAQRWKPTLPLAVYKRDTSGGNTANELHQSGNEDHPSYYCPKASMRLTELDRATLEGYLSAANGFRAIGSTYHDIGMIWGSRFISPHGLFSADNATAPNGDAIGRHIVFMTDGELSVNNEVYTPYGVHWWDRRVTSSTNINTVSARHAARFQAACRQARQENISVWVVAFGTELTQNLIDCATPGRAYEAGDSAELAEKFEEIAEKIAALRLTN